MSKKKPARKRTPAVTSLEIQPRPRAAAIARELLHVRTVFVSSRMEDLVAERTAVLKAVYDCGLTPLLYEIEPFEDSITKIDAMVDRADMFLGIYDQSIGDPQANLNGLYPIEYELYRFILGFTRYRLRATDYQMRINERNKLTDELKRAATVKFLRSQLSDYLNGRLPASAPLQSVFANRILLFRRTGCPASSSSRQGDRIISSELVDFLRPFTVHGFSSSIETR